MKQTTLLLSVLLIALAVPVYSCAAEEVYQAPEVFVMESFDGKLPSPQTLFIQGDLQEKMQKIMGKHYKLPDVRYWARDNRTVWILEDIGKYKPITAGFVVDADGKLERVKVLIYRESHGWEVKHDFFTRQFKGAALKKGKKLDKRIDGISGATLSVDALKRMSALALLLHENVSSGP